MRASANGNRTYHLGLSKQMMKLSRYSPSGSTQRKGMTAMSWHNLLVVASKRIEAQAGKRSQRRGEECRVSSVEGIGPDVDGFFPSTLDTRHSTLQSLTAHNPQPTA